MNVDKLIGETFDVIVFSVLAGLALVGYANLFQGSAYTKGVLGFVTVFALTHRLLERNFKKKQD